MPIERKIYMENKNLKLPKNIEVIIGFREDYVEEHAFLRFLDNILHYSELQKMSEDKFQVYLSFLLNGVMNLKTSDDNEIFLTTSDNYLSLRYRKSVFLKENKKKTVSVWWRDSKAFNAVKQFTKLFHNVLLYADAQNWRNEEIIFYIRLMFDGMIGTYLEDFDFYLGSQLVYTEHLSTW